MAKSWLDQYPAASPLDVALVAEGVSGQLADIARSVYEQESSSGKNAKTSNAGAVGGMQVIPATFHRVADKGWSISDPVDNARAGVRYLKLLYERAGGDPQLTAAGYYGGEGAQDKAKQGQAVRDPRNPNAPDTLQYARQVTSRMGNSAKKDDLGWLDAYPVAEAPDVDGKSSAPEAAKKESGPADFVRRAARFATPAGIATSLASPEGRQDMLDAAAGAVRGAGSIGATIVDSVRSRAAKPVLDVVPQGMRPDVTAQLPEAPDSQQMRSGMDSALREMGADPNSLMFRGGKLGTEIAGTLGAGGAVAAPLRAAAAVVPRAAPALSVAAEAVASGGFRTGATMGRVADMATRIAGGAVSGGASAGLVDPNDAGTGAAIGAALPPALRGATAAFDATAKAARSGASVVSSRAARSKAVETIGQTLGDDAAQAVADIQTHFPKGAENIPLSAAAITRNPRLAQMEQGSRLREGATWFEFDQKQGRAVFDNVLRATSEAGDLGERYAQRQEHWREMWAKASQNLKPRLWVARMTQFGADLETALRSPEAANPGVRGVLEAINAEMDRVGPAFSPAHLQQLRANLNGKAQPLSPDVFKSAPRDSFAIKSLIKEMDDILNVSTGGKWQKVLETYAADSDLVRASKAAAKVRSAFVDADTGRVLGTATDTGSDVIPRITEAGLNRAMNAARMPDKTLALSQGANQQLEATVDALRRQNIVQGVKRTATAGGGSDTMSNAIAAGAAEMAGTPNIILRVVDAARRIGTAKTDKEIAALLSNPDDLARALQPWLNRPAAPTALPGARFAPALPVVGAAAAGGDQAQSDPLAQISQAQSVDEAIQAASSATNSVKVPPPPLFSAPMPSPAPTPAGAKPAPQAPGNKAQPVAIWVGRRGDGYQDEASALNALPSRQRANPELRWEVERMPSGTYRLAAYEPPNQMGGLSLAR